MPESRVDSDSSTIIVEEYGDANFSGEDADIPLKEPNAVRAPTSEPAYESESYDQEVAYYDFSSESGIENKDTSILDGVVSDESYYAASAESGEPLFSVILQIVIPISVVVSGIILERMLSRWWNKRKQIIKKRD